MDDGWFDALDLSDVVHSWPMVTLEVLKGGQKPLVGFVASAIPQQMATAVVALLIVTGCAQPVVPFETNEQLGDPRFVDAIETADDCEEVADVLQDAATNPYGLDPRVADVYDRAALDRRDELGC